MRKFSFVNRDYQSFGFTTEIGRRGQFGTSSETFKFFAVTVGGACSNVPFS